MVKKKYSCGLAWVLLVGTSTSTGCWSSSQENTETDSIKTESPKDSSVPENETPFPLKATADATKALLASNPLPSSDELDSCKGEIGESALSSQATAEETTQLLKQNLAADRPKYHWCFFYDMALLDKFLASEKSTFQEKGSRFLADMDYLSQLAKALDEKTESNPYFHWLRKRYIEISKSHFGRNLETIHKNTPMKRKPAGPATTDSSK